MGTVYAEIELTNSDDLADARRHRIGEEEVRRMNVSMLVDTGSYELCINENIQAYLRLPFRERKRCQTADGRVVECDIVGPVDIRFGEKSTACLAYVLPGDNEPLLGAIPLEGLNATIYPRLYRMIVNPEGEDSTMQPI